MPSYRSPGVYVEEKDAGPKPIEGVSTSVAGAVGVTERGPSAGKPELVTSFAQFVRAFGGYLSEPAPSIVTAWSGDEGGHWWSFPLAVKGFFDNGGEQLYVKRVVASTAVASSATLGHGLVSGVVKDAQPVSPPATQPVKLAHLIGIEVGSQIELINGSDGSQVTHGGGANTTFNVTAYDSATGTATVETPDVELKASRGDFAQIHPRSADVVPANEQTLIFDAASPGAWGDELEVRVQPTVAATLNLLGDPAAGGPAAQTTLANLAAAGATTVDLVDITDFANNDTVLIEGEEYVISNVTAGNPDTFDVAPVVPAGGWAAGVAVKRLRPVNNPAQQDRVHVWGAARLYTGALVELDNGTAKETLTVNSTSGDQVTLSGNLANSYLEGNKLRLVEAAPHVRLVRDGATEAEEIFPPMRLVDDGGLNYIVRHVNERSDLVSVQLGANFSSSNLADFPTSPNGGYRAFGGGDDKLAELTVDAFVGADGGSGLRTGIQALEDIDEVSICVAPGMWAPIIQGALIQHCEILADRFAVLDPPPGLSIEEIREFRDPIDTKYAALYYPWIEVRDPSVSRNVEVAPSAHMAGIYARVDIERGVHKAPANEVIRGITSEGIAQDVTRREQDLLNPNGINALRTFPGRGHRVWGARTLSSDGSWKYINVRRLFLYVEESIDEGTQWVVFEPNDEPLWARVRQTISNFLTTTWRSGALQGATPDQAFFVRCDNTTMTQDDIDNGRLICEIGIAPVKPAEFVIFRIQQKTLETAAN